MDNWIYVCDKNDIDFEDLNRSDHKNKTFFTYNIKDGFMLLKVCVLMKMFT